jgi:heat shock protein HslJ
MRRKFLILIFLAATFSGAAYGQRGLAGQDWTLTYLNGIDVGSVDAHMKIDKSGKRLTGSTGCNILNGPVKIRGTGVEFGPMITTKRACNAETGRVEGGFLAALERAASFRLSRGRLQLFQGRKLLAEFSKRTAVETIPDDDRSTLSDRKWVLASIDQEPVSAVEQEAFINFDPSKGSAGGNTSCNAFGGEYKVTGSKFKFSAGISTMRACIEDERMEIERKFLDRLRLADRFTINGDELILYRGQKNILSFIGKQK